MKTKLLRLFALILFSSLIHSQSHTIEIHPDGQVASLLMSPTEYNSWITNNDFTNTTKRTALFQDIYQGFSDDFDFIFLILNEDAKPANLPFGQLIQVSNSDQGLGLGNFDNSGAYGSNGKLKAVMHLTRRTYIQNGPSLHELMHNWANFGIDTESVSGTGSNLTSFGFKPHWGFTGGSSKGQLGGFSQSSLIDNGGNSYTVESFGSNANGGNSIPYNELELYLMGMIPISQVSNFDVFSNITSLTVNGSIFDFEASQRTMYTPSLLESNLGARVPSSTSSQKDFKLLIIAVTPSALTTPQWDLLNEHSEEFGRTADNGNSTYNFWEATNGLGTMETGNLNNTVLGINENNLTSVLFFPNPVKNDLSIKSSNELLKRFVLTNSLGQKVLENVVNDPVQAYSIDMRKYTNGVYFLKIFTDNGKSSTKKILLDR